MTKVIIKSLLALSVIIFTATTQAAIFKCKTASGSINYSATPCPVGSDKKDISTIAKSKQEQGFGKARVSIYDIKTASDGLSNILRGGFANESLKTLKEDHLYKNNRSNAYILHKRGALWKQYLYVTIKSYSQAGIKIRYFLKYNKQNAQKLSKFELAREEKDFDLSLMDVNVHAARVGLKNKASQAKKVGAKSIKWEWFEEGFKCKMSARVDKKNIEKNELKYECQFLGH